MFFSLHAFKLFKSQILEAGLLSYPHALRWFVGLTLQTVIQITASRSRLTGSFELHD